MRTLSHQEARRTYDRIGSLQDSQGFYEDRATALVVHHGNFACGEFSDIVATPKVIPSIGIGGSGLSGNFDATKLRLRPIVCVNGLKRIGFVIGSNSMITEIVILTPNGLAHWQLSVRRAFFLCKKRDWSQLASAANC